MQHIISSLKIIVKPVVVFLFLVVTLKAYTQTAPVAEYNMKAVFLYNFTQFVEWPPNAFDNDKPFIIGILGEDPFRSYIDDAVSGEKVNGRSIEVRRFNTVQDIATCHILFISNSEAAKVREILSALPGKSILTVSDIPDFARTGGMIRFVQQNNKIKLQINTSAAKAADLNISSKLLRLANLVSL